MSLPRVCLVAVAVILIAGSAQCADTEKPTPTYVGTLEKTVLTFMKPIEKVEEIGRGIGNTLKDWISEIPGIKGVQDHLQSRNETRKSLADILNPFTSKIRAIYPGTRWCGDGDIADSEDDLGFFESTDKCCRAHDSCKDGIAAQDTEHGLLNNGIFTRSACHCDEDFYSCLKEAKSVVALNIGTTYFNILRPQCFKEEYPIEKCKVYARNHLIDDKCLVYSYNTNGTKKYQWFDNPDFLG